MGSDYAMYPPQPIYRTEVYYHVGTNGRQRGRDRVLELLNEGRMFKVSPHADQLVLHIHTGKFQ